MTVYYFTECQNGDLRLVGGTHPAEGRLEFCFGGVWGTVCNDQWGAEDALVACRQLGFINIGEYFTQRVDCLQYIILLV